MVLGGEMNKKTSPMARLRRMRRMFAKNFSILIEDYEHFTQGAAIRQNTGSHKLATLHGQPALKPS